jgi:hypothetical protein
VAGRDRTEPEPALPQAQVRDGHRLPGGAGIHPGSLFEVLFDLGEEIGGLAGRGCPSRRTVLVNHGQRAAVSAQQPGDRLDALAQRVGVVAGPAHQRDRRRVDRHVTDRLLAQRVRLGLHLGQVANEGLIVHRELHHAEPPATLRYPMTRR